MIPVNALVIYKTKPAAVKERTEDKYNITLIYGTQAKVREKDIELLHPGPVNNFDDFFDAEKSAAEINGKIREAWELLSGEDSDAFSLKELASIIFGDFTPVSAYAAYCVLQDGLYFRITEHGTGFGAIAARCKEEVENEIKTRNEKKREIEDRADFLDKCRNYRLSKEDIANAPRFVQDVEALAFGKSAKSRTLKDLKLRETPEDAHEFLLKTGIWTNMVNPHPSRFGISLASADVCPDEPPEENRKNLCGLNAFAIDSSWTDDPDDAVSYEKIDGQNILYVHVADPASAIFPGSPAEKEARDRGATLYLPEATVRMISEKALSLFALGLGETSPALTFKITVNESGEIDNTEIFPSIIKTRRLSYEEADKEMETNESLRALDEFAKLFFKRRCENGAVNIDLPDVHISVENDYVDVQPVPRYRSSLIVKECMIAAGVAAGTWASEKGLAMPYLSQQAELPNEILPGLAGFMQLRKSMKPRVVSVKPGRHQGMGLEIYTQVTSPLRRYTDLLAHMQIRAFLRAEQGFSDAHILSDDEMSSRLGYSEAAVTACVQAERASDTHWKMVYLSGKKDSVWDAVAIEKKINRWLVFIPALALETYVVLDKEANPGDEVKLVLKSVNIPHTEAVFLHCG